jgi:hypothetical protein
MMAGLDIGRKYCHRNDEGADVSQRMKEKPHPSTLIKWIAG